MAGALKKTTGLTGLLVAVEPQVTLSILYSKILRTLQKMPESAAYRKHTEALINNRAQIVKSTDCVQTMEKQIGCGQIEEVIVQAENELSLSRKMLTWKPWESLVNEAPASQWAWPPTK